MTTILAPATTADRLTETLATYVNEHSCDSGGGHQRTMLLAALITRLFDVEADEAIDLARNAPYDERVCVASDAREELLDRARRARENAEYSTTEATR